MKPESEVAIPYKAGDYCAAGLAIVSCLKGEFGRLLQDYHAGIFYTPGQAISLFNSLVKLNIDRHSLNTLRHGSKMLASEKFERSVAYSKFADWIEVQSRRPTTH